jgi:hypothetical protein
MTSTTEMPAMLVLGGVGRFREHLRLPKNLDAMTPDDYDALQNFVAVTALHGDGLYQAQTAVQDFPWLLHVWWELGDKGGYGWLKVSNLWRPKPFKLEMLGAEWLEEPPQGYVHCTVAELALLELTAAIPKDLADELRHEPDDDEAATRRIGALLDEVHARTWGAPEWFMSQRPCSDEAEQNLAMLLRFADGSDLFVTAYGFSLESPVWLEEGFTPETLKLRGIQVDTPVMGRA